MSCVTSFSVATITTTILSSTVTTLPASGRRDKRSQESTVVPPEWREGVLHPGYEVAVGVVSEFDKDEPVSDDSEAKLLLQKRQGGGFYCPSSAPYLFDESLCGVGNAICEPYQYLVCTQQPGYSFLSSGDCRNCYSTGTYTRFIGEYTTSPTTSTTTTSRAGSVVTRTSTIISTLTSSSPIVSCTGTTQSSSSVTSSVASSTATAPAGSQTTVPGDQQSSKTNVGAIAGGAAGGGIALIAAIALLVFCMRRKKKNAVVAGGYPYPDSKVDSPSPKLDGSSEYYAGGGGTGQTAANEVPYGNNAPYGQHAAPANEIPYVPNNNGGNQLFNPYEAAAVGGGAAGLAAGGGAAASYYASSQSPSGDYQDQSRPMSAVSSVPAGLRPGSPPVSPYPPAVQEGNLYGSPMVTNPDLPQSPSMVSSPTTMVTSPTMSEVDRDARNLTSIDRESRMLM